MGEPDVWMTSQPCDQLIVAVMETGTGRRNRSSGIKGSPFPRFFCVGLNPPPKPGDPGRQDGGQAKGNM